MKPSKKEIEEAKAAAKKVEKKTTKKETEVKDYHIDEIWNELTEIKKQLIRTMDRLGLEYE